MILANSGIVNAMYNIMSKLKKSHYGKMSDIYLYLSNSADTSLKQKLSSPHILTSLTKILDMLPADILVKILRFFKNLSTDPLCIPLMINAGIVPRLVNFLECRLGLLVMEVHNQVLSTLYNLCRNNKQVQEEATKSGIVPHLQFFIGRKRSVNQFALYMFRDLLDFPLTDREKYQNSIDIILSQLWEHSCLDTVLEILSVSADVYRTMRGITSWYLLDNHRLEEAFQKDIKRVDTFVSNLASNAFTHFKLLLSDFYEFLINISANLKRAFISNNNYRIVDKITEYLRTHQMSGSTELRTNIVIHIVTSKEVVFMTLILTEILKSNILTVDRINNMFERLEPVLRKLLDKTNSKVVNERISIPSKYLKESTVREEQTITIRESVLYFLSLKA